MITRRSLKLDLFIFLSIFGLLVVIEIVLLYLLTNDPLTSIKETLDIFFGLKSPFEEIEGILNPLQLAIIIMGYVLIAFNWLGFPILIVQLYLKKSAELAKKEKKMAIMLIKKGVKAKGGLNQLEDTEELMKIVKSSLTRAQSYHKKKKNYDS